MLLRGTPTSNLATKFEVTVEEVTRKLNVICYLSVDGLAEHF